MAQAQKQQNDALYRPKTAFDLLSIPIIGSALKSRYGRLILQIPFIILAILMLYDGFVYSSTPASRNLATVLPWVHYRGLVVLALLLVGNLFCMGCPFTIPRTLAKRLSIRGRRFPRFLRNKWLAIGALFTIFFFYEWLDLWASPYLTAWVIVAYFVASFVLEAIFSESAFCKYVCPLGTFNFVYSTASPTQIAVKNHDVCASCVGKECVNGSYASQATIRIDEIPIAGSAQTKQKEVIHSPQGTLGCGTELFPPQMTSNMDCVFCLDCVRACPHDNIGLMTRTWGRELFKFGALPKRWDISFLLISFAFMAIVNAFGMVPPVFDLLEWFAGVGFTSEFIPLLIIFSGGGLLLPAIAMLLAGFLTRQLTNTAKKYSLRDTVANFAPAFVPIGFGIWLAHYGFHWLIAPFSFIPIFQEFLGMTGSWAQYGQPLDNQFIGIIQVIALLGGFLWSMVIAQRTALRLYKRQSFIGLMPWALLLLLLMFSAYQVFSLPMEMRGTEELFTIIRTTIS